MEPAISENSWVIAKRAGFRRRDPRRFDVVRFENPEKSPTWEIKRIVGLPGEQVSLRSGELFVEDVLVPDRFAYCPDPVTDNQDWWLREDEYVVLGDNRTPSRDSRKFGPIKRNAILGRVIS